MTTRNRPVLCATRGLPGSGKSTWARKMCADNSNARRVNKDDLRRMLNGDRPWSRQSEKVIVAEQEAMVRRLLKAGHDVIVDDTNLEGSHISRWGSVAREEGADLIVEDFTHVPLETCIGRDLRRLDSVGKDVIMRMFDAALRPAPPEVKRLEGAPSAVLVDMDGTLAIMGDRSAYDESRCFEDSPNRPVVQFVQDAFRGKGWEVFILSGRDEGRGRAETERWLEHHDVPYTSLFMRAAGDTRKDSIVKREIYEAEVEGQVNVEVVLDDRDQVVELWRSLGLPTWQVNYGNF